MAARKKKPKRRDYGRSTEIHRGPTRDPGPTGNVGCWVIFLSLVVIILIGVLMQVFGS